MVSNQPHATGTFPSKRSLQ